MRGMNNPVEVNSLPNHMHTKCDDDAKNVNSQQKQQQQKRNLYIFASCVSTHTHTHESQ